MSQVLTALIRRLGTCYGPDAARAIARRVLEEPPMSLPSAELFFIREEELPEEKLRKLQDITDRLLLGEPVQYVLGQEQFCGLTLQVGPGVLIPRPETQELVEWVVSEYSDALQIADLCTGSGCIAAALADRLPSVTVSAIDYSDEALAYARLNLRPFAERVRVLKADVLSPSLTLPTLDVLVSNPPYIAEEERESMDSNVKDWEPSIALFVPDDDPLRFYRAIGELGLRSVRKNGAVYVEINQRFGKEICALYCSLGYQDVTLRTDAFGQERMVKAVKK